LNFGAKAKKQPQRSLLFVPAFFPFVPDFSRFGPFPENGLN
jgi:hypothetical protein